MTLEDDRPGDFLDPRATKPVVGDSARAKAPTGARGTFTRRCPRKLLRSLLFHKTLAPSSTNHSAFEDEEVCITPARPIGAEAARLVHDEYDDGMARQALQWAQRNLVPDVDSVLT